MGLFARFSLGFSRPLCPLGSSGTVADHVSQDDTLRPRPEARNLLHRTQRCRFGYPTRNGLQCCTLSHLGDGPRKHQSSWCDMDALQLLNPRDVASVRQRETSRARRSASALHTSSRTLRRLSSTTTSPRGGAFTIARSPGALCICRVLRRIVSAVFARTLGQRYFFRARISSAMALRARRASGVGNMGQQWCCPSPST